MTSDSAVYCVCINEVRPEESVCALHLLLYVCRRVYFNARVEKGVEEWSEIQSNVYLYRQTPTRRQQQQEERNESKRHAQSVTSAVSGRATS